MARNDTIEVTIMSPLAVVWHGSARSLSATNSEGTFDVLPDHARFVTLIDPVPIVVRQKKGEEHTFTFKNAVLFFQDNSAKIYIHENQSV